MAKEIRRRSTLLGLLMLLSMPLYAQDVARDSVLHEVEVTAQRHSFSAKSLQMSAVSINAEQIRKVPSLMGEADVLKSLQMLPGVQGGGEGRVGIYVRGGDYDQNLFMLDGITLYNPEHLQGFTSAINSDLMDDVVLYKGAFPSRFGSRLSSIIDIYLREGDMENYHASVTAGMLASRIQAEGPMWKGHTSFNIGARMSYFNALVRPLLEEVVYDNPGQMNNYAHMKYHDINAKLTYRFSENAKLNAIFYYGYDQNNTTPNETKQHYEYSGQEAYTFITKTSFTDNQRNDWTLNHWNNLLGGLNFRYRPKEAFQLDASINYSSYDYELSHLSMQENKVQLDRWGHGIDSAELYSHKSTYRNTTYKSGIEEWTGKADLTFNLQGTHELHVGVHGSTQLFQPSVMTDYHRELKQALSEEIVWNIGLGEDRYTFSENDRNSRLEGDFRLNSFSAYAEDDWNLTNRLEANAGLRLQAYEADGKKHLLIEPRASLRLMLDDNTSVKASYARMSQGMFLLTSGSIVSPSEVWIPLNKDMSPGVSDQLSLGVNHDLASGLQLSLEGYYKWLDNVAEYREGLSFMTVNDWNDAIAQGQGRAYGVEFLAQKTVGNTRGHVSYTWSKSIRTFDRPEMELNGGREFYATGDHRHNFNITITQRLSKNWDFTAAWTYQSGKRTNIAASTVSHGLPDEYNAYFPGSVESTTYSGVNYDLNPAFAPANVVYQQGTYVNHLIRMDTYYQRNSYQLPAVHRLDVNFSHHGNIGIGEMICDVGIYNLYNRQNLSSVYWGYKNNRLSLKGVCLFPIMPYLSLTLKL
ncbi:MAG: TonB-dependent receptor [Bacteroidaceae bacterium]|nr:TonB-dependent receptor [Bacteroidaceae bacterium]